MTAEVLKGKPVSDVISSGICGEVGRLRKAGVTPRLAVVRLGARPDDLAYERGIVKRCNSLGVDTKVCALSESCTESDVLALVADLGRDPSIHGILPFRPLPPQIAPGSLKRVIAPGKDVDCIGPFSAAAVFDRTLPGFLPCTSEAVMEMLNFYRVSLGGANVVILGRSLVVGRALALLMMDADATVTVCHSKTRNIQEIASRGDVLVCAMGRAKKVDSSYVKPGAVVIDVGINEDGNGGICGDVEDESVAKVAGALSPVPGGIGGVTTTILIRNVARACALSMA